MLRAEQVLYAGLRLITLSNFSCCIGCCGSFLKYYGPEENVPAAQLSSAEAVRNAPPLTDDSKPLAVFSLPPLTDDEPPLALFAAPPLTEESTPMAVFTNPPLTEDALPLASLANPP